MAKISYVGIRAFNGASPTDAWFRTFEALSDALTAMGLPKTSDTGQIDWATVTYPGDGVVTAYEIRRFADSAQGTWPVYIKIFYYFSSGTVRYPGVRITVGTGSNGSGDLTGDVGLTVQANLTINTVAWTGYMGGESSGFSTSFQERWYLGIERMRDADGALTPYLLLYRYSEASSATSYAEPASWLIDMRNGSVVAPGSIPIFYWRDLSGGGPLSLLAGTPLYPFGVIQYPTRDHGVVRAKYCVGAGASDFAIGALIPIPRFSAKTEYLYQRSPANAFGTGPRGVATTIDDSQVYGAALCVYWQ